MKTVLITGCSSGYGLETALYFHQQGWNVVATMRSPRPGILPVSDRIRVLPLDVTQPESIARVVRDAGPIDVLVNNAGIGVVGAFEATAMPTVREVFDTNTFGTLAMCQAVIPQMRERQAGVIVNVTSSVTLASMPFAAAYTSSKTAVEGFTGSLALELGAFGVRAKLIPEAYADFARPIFAAFAQPSAVTYPQDVAEAVWRAANDVSDQLHFPAGADAIALAGPQ
jgi:NAD(P)-dependent dehydrogenase (short-subunit alcohol dehydrogenase family)